MIHSPCRGMLYCVIAPLVFCGLFVLAGFQDPASSLPAAESQQPDSSREEILASLTIQSDCWNAGDITGFMQTYWKSEEMTFSSGGTTHVGWQAALDRYRKNYPVEKMGKLKFEAGPLTLLGADAALLLGKYSLEREGDVSGGNFSLVLRRFPEGWRIIHDHSSSLEVEESVENAGGKADSRLPPVRGDENPKKVDGV